ncbi:MAG: GHMP kinase [Dialister sp.]|nr:GHMP kinase [Dialister sp.]
MVYVVRSPGSCGEFIQGYMEGSSFMVTCPVNRYAEAETGFAGKGDELPEKADKARELTLRFLGRQNEKIPVKLHSCIQKSKGMASSTADISAVAKAVSLACGQSVSNRDIAEISLAIEPSDATFFKGVTLFDYRHGKIIQELGNVPAMNLLIYDCGGEVDTLQFNSRTDLLRLQKENERTTTRALSLFIKGIEKQSLDLIGKAATISAFVNQRILYKAQLPLFWKIGKKAGGKGVVCAHSGTVLGLIVPGTMNIDRIRECLDDSLEGKMTWLDTVQITNHGMTVEEI